MVVSGVTCKQSWRCVLEAVLKTVKVSESWMEAGTLFQVAGASAENADVCLWKSGET